ncbi:MAG TPA: hypothetical protein VN973_04625 [Candidatus Dormibacteraeota bacterium]|nr:hypothetical protein [Candidatus Dormibacteraeota bacterium]
MPTWLNQLLDARTVLGFALGIAAAAIAILLQARIDHRRWLRQQRLEAFAAFLSALDSMHRPATRWQLSWGRPGEEPERERFFDQMEALDRIGGRIHLLSSTVVNRAAIDVLRQWTIEINSALKTHDADRMAHALDGIPPQYRKLIELARRELGQKPAFLEQKDFDAFEGDRARLRDVVPDQLRPGWKLSRRPDPGHEERPARG